MPSEAAENCDGEVYNRLIEASIPSEREDCGQKVLFAASLCKKKSRKKIGIVCAIRPEMLIWPPGVSDLKGPLGKVPCDGERAVAHDRNYQGHARDCAANFVYDIIKAFITIIEALSRSLQCCLESRPPLEKHLRLVIRRGGESNRQGQPIGGISFLAMISASSGHENRDTGPRYAKHRFWGLALG